MDPEYMEQLAWLTAFNEDLERFRRGALPGYRQTDCTCPSVWMSILPPPPCPFHGQFDNWQITC